MLAPDSNIEPDQSLVQQVIAEKGLKDGQYEVYYRVWDKLGGVVPLTQHGFVMRSEHPHITPDFAGRHTVDNIQDPLNRKLFLSLLTSCSQRNHQERYMSATSFFEWALWEAIRRVDTGVHEQVYISTIIVPSTAVDSDNPCLVFEAYPLRDAGSGKHGIPDGKRDPLHFARRAYENKFYAKIPAEYVMSTIVLYRDIPPTLPEIRQAISLNPQLANDGPCFHQTCYRARSYGSKDAIPFIHSRARAAGMSPDVVPLNIIPPPLMRTRGLLAQADEHQVQSEHAEELLAKQRAQPLSTDVPLDYRLKDGLYDILRPSRQGGGSYFMYLGPDQINFKGLWRGDLRLFEHQDGRHLWVMQYDYDSGSYFVEGKISRACLARTFEENGLTMSFRRVITPETLHKDRGLQRAAEQRERSKAPDRSGKGDEVDGLRLSELKRQPRSRTVSSSAHTRKAKS